MKHYSLSSQRTDKEDYSLVTLICSSRASQFCI